MYTTKMGIYDGIPIPSFISNFGQIINIFGSNYPSDCVRLFVVDEVLLSDFTPPSTLAVEDPNNSGEIIEIPDLQKTAYRLIQVD